MTDSIAPRDELWRLITGFQTSQAIHVAAKLGIADRLGEKPRSSTELAASTGTHVVNLRRLLRTLASAGVLYELGDDTFALTEVGTYLRADVPSSHAAMARLFGADSTWSAWGGLLHAVRTGQTAFDHTHGMDVWCYRAAHPGAATLFDDAMGGSGKAFATAVLQTFDFSSISSIVDIGGANGSFLAAILAATPHLRGVLFDQPHVIAEARRILAQRLLGPRLEFTIGDFFKSVPDGHDAYLLKWILHDWSNEDSLRILASCHRAMRPDSRLLLVEHVIGAPNMSLDGKLMDLNMMVMTGGRERTREEFEELLTASGFEIVTIAPTQSMLSIIEARPMQQPPNKACTVVPDGN